MYLMFAHLNCADKNPPKKQHFLCLFPCSGNNMKIITGDGVSATITVRMKQSPEGHLSVEIQYCKVKTDTIRTKPNNVFR